MKEILKFIDTSYHEHIVNMDYLVQLRTETKTEWDNSGRKVRDYIVYLVNIACAEVACYNAKEYEVDKEVYEKIKGELCNI